MKRSGWIFTLCAVCFVVFVFFAFKNGRHDFDWNASYDPHSEEPFGTQLFDSLMKRTLPEGYESRYVSDAELQRWSQDTVTPHNLLFLPDVYGVEEENARRILRMVKHGSHVMVVNPLPSEWGQYLHYGLENDHLTWFDFQKMVQPGSDSDTRQMDTLVWVGDILYPYAPTSDSLGYASDTTLVWRALSSHVYLDSCYFRQDMVTLISNAREDQTAVTFLHGKGSLTLVANTLLFTNLGVMQPSSRKLVLRLMNGLSHSPVVRCLPEREQDSSGGVAYFFKVMAKYPPMVLAWRLLLIGCLLALTVNARRRQRAIPLLKHSRNATLDFLRQHVTLFRKSTDHASLVRMRHRAFAAELRRKWQVDVEETDPHERRVQVERLASLLGRDVHSVMLDLDFLDRLRTTEGHVSPALFMEAVACMKRLSEQKDEAGMLQHVSQSQSDNTTPNQWKE